MAFDGSGCSVSTSGTTERAVKEKPWTSAEDEILMEYVLKHGEGNWGSVQKLSGLDKSAKSCRNRCANYLRRDLKKGAFSTEEEEIIVELHGKHGLPVQENYANFGFNPGPKMVVLALPAMRSPEMVTSTLKQFSSDHVIATPNNAAWDFEVMESEFMQGTGDEASGSGINFIDDELSKLLNNFPLVVPLPEWDDLHPRPCSDSSCKD